MNKPQSITTLPESPDEERDRRLRRYLLAMGIRLACVIACFFVHGWWLLIPAIGAVVLPYVAVVLANARMSNPGAAIESVSYALPQNRDDTTQ